jgi:glycosyltransferase involved in cell wall biosynthesis
MEVIIIDGGSKDSTLEIVGRYRVRVLHNPLRTGEAGKYVGLKEASGRLVAFIDSDNVLPSRNWIKLMISPLNNRAIAGSEPFAFTYKKELPIISRYMALFGACDPLQLFIGNRERWSWLHKNVIQEDKHKVEDKGTFYQVVLRGGIIPTLGANGFIGRRNLLLENCSPPYYFDIDVVYNLVHKGFKTFAMPKIGIIHLFARNIRQFIRKTYRRIYEYLHLRSLRGYPWIKKRPIMDAIRFLLYSFSLFLPARDSIKGYKVKPDIAWFFHPMACILVSFVYGITYLLKYGLE